MRDKRTTLFFLLSFLLGSGFIFGPISAGALLVGHIGTKQLFDVYLFNGLFILPLWGLLYILVDRFSHITIFHSIYVISILLVALCFETLHSSPSESWIYIAVRVLFHAIYFLTLNQFWVLTSQFFTYFEIKRRSPYFTVANMLGRLVTGLFVSWITKFISTTYLILPWIIVLFLCVVIVTTLKKPLLQHHLVKFLAETDNKKLLTNTSAKWSRTNFNLLITLLLFWAIYTFIRYGTDYTYNTIAKQTLHTESQLVFLFGIVTSISAAALIIYQLLFSRLFIERFGLPVSILVITLSTALPLLLFKVMPNLYTIAIAEGIIYSLLDFIAAGRLNVISNVFADEQRGRVKIFSEGIGGSVGCVCIYLASFTIKSDIQVFFWIVLSTALIYALLYPYFFHKTYTKHLLESLKNSSGILLTSISQALGERYYSQATQPLTEILQTSTSTELKQAVANSLGRIQNNQALTSLIKTFPSQDIKTQLEILKAITQYNSYEALFALLKLTKYNPNMPLDQRFNSTILLTKWLGKKAMPHLIELLLDPDLRIKANAIEAIALLKDSKTTSLLINFLQDKNLRIRTNTIIALYPFKRYKAQTQQALNELLTSDNPERQRSGIYAIGMLRLHSYHKELIDIANNSSNKITVLFAGFALAQIGDEHFTQILLPILENADQYLIQEAHRLIKKLSHKKLLLLLEKAETFVQYKKQSVQTLLNNAIPYTSMLEKII